MFDNGKCKKLLNELFEILPTRRVFEKIQYKVISGNIIELKAI